MSPMDDGKSVQVTGFRNDPGFRIEVMVGLAVDQPDCSQGGAVCVPVLAPGESPADSEKAVAYRRAVEAARQQ